MPRKQRIQFPGAVYHVISRGNHYHLAVETPEANLVEGMKGYASPATRSISSVRQWTGCTVRTS